MNSQSDWKTEKKVGLWIHPDKTNDFLSNKYLQDQFGHNENPIEVEAIKPTKILDQELPKTVRRFGLY